MRTAPSQIRAKRGAQGGGGHDTRSSRWLVPTLLSYARSRRKSTRSTRNVPYIEDAVVTMVSCPADEGTQTSRHMRLILYGTMPLCRSFGVVLVLGVAVLMGLPAGVNLQSLTPSPGIHHPPHHASLSSVSHAGGRGNGELTLSVPPRPMRSPPGDATGAHSTTAHTPLSSSGSYEWVGAYTNQLGQSPFAGLQTIIDVQVPTIPSPGYGYYAYDMFGFDASTTTGSLIDLGYIYIRGDASTWGPYPFYVNETGYIQAVCGSGALASGTHVFAVTPVSGGPTWSFTVDGNVICTWTAEPESRREIA